MQIYRTLALEISVSLNPATWEELLISLLFIQDQLLNTSKKFKQMQGAGEIAEMVVGTVLFSWVRSRTKSQELWLKLRALMEKCTSWKETISQWNVRYYPLIPFKTK